MNTIRSFQYAGSFYPTKAEDINQFITTAFANVVTDKILQKKPKIIIVPHAGYVYSGNVAAYAYKAISSFNYSNIILLGPSHHALASNKLLTCTYTKFETPLGDICTFKSNISLSLCENNNKAHLLEHSLEIQLPFLKYLYKDCKIFPQLINEGDEKSLMSIGNFETQILNDTPDSLLVISSDLSHYHSYAEAQEIDRLTVGAILQLDEAHLQSGGEACGLTPILIGIKIAKQLKLNPVLLRMANSGDATNSFNTPVVGYAAIVFY